MVSSKNWIRLQSQAMCSKSQSGSSISHIEFEQDIKVLAKNLRSLLKKDPNICRERSAKTNHLREKLAFTLQHGFPAFWFTPSLCLPSSSCSFSLPLCSDGSQEWGNFLFFVSVCLSQLKKDISLRSFVLICRLVSAQLRAMPWTWSAL